MLPEAGGKCTLIPYQSILRGHFFRNVKMLAETARDSSVIFAVELLAFHLPPLPPPFTFHLSPLTFLLPSA